MGRRDGEEEAGKLEEEKQRREDSKDGGKGRGEEKTGRGKEEKTREEGKIRLGEREKKRINEAKCNRMYVYQKMGCQSAGCTSIKIGYKCSHYLQQSSLQEESPYQVFDRGVNEQSEKNDAGTLLTL